MGKISRTNSYLLLMVLVDFLLVSAGLYILFDFRNNKLAEVDDLNIKLLSLQSSSKRQDAVSRTIKATKDDRDRLNLYFITKETTSNFIEELESVAARSAVAMKLNSLVVGREGKQANSPSYLKINLRAERVFSDIFHFLTALESLPYRVRINAVRVARLNEENVAGKNKKIPWYIEASFDLVSYIDK